MQQRYMCFSKYQIYFYNFLFCHFVFYILLCEKLSIMAEKQIMEIDNRDEVLEWLKENERDLAWLSRKTGIVYATLYSIFIQRLFKISEENLKKINEATDLKLKD